MINVKHNHTDEELDAMNPDDFYEALGLTERVHEEIYAARDGWFNCTGVFYKWDPDKEDHGMSNPTMIVRTDTLQ